MSDDDFAFKGRHSDATSKQPPRRAHKQSHKERRGATPKTKRHKPSGPPATSSSLSHPPPPHGSDPSLPVYQAARELVCRWATTHSNNEDSRWWEGARSLAEGGREATRITSADVVAACDTISRFLRHQSGVDSADGARTNSAATTTTTAATRNSASSFSSSSASTFVPPMQPAFSNSSSVATTASSTATVTTTKPQQSPMLFAPSSSLQAPADFLGNTSSSNLLPPGNSGDLMPNMLDDDALASATNALLGSNSQAELGDLLLSLDESSLPSLFANQESSNDRVGSSSTLSLATQAAPALQPPQPQPPQPPQPQPPQPPQPQPPQPPLSGVPASLTMTSPAEQGHLQSVPVQQMQAWMLETARNHNTELFQNLVNQFATGILSNEQVRTLFTALQQKLQDQIGNAATSAMPPSTTSAVNGGSLGMPTSLPFSTSGSTPFDNATMHATQHEPSSAATLMLQQMLAHQQQLPSFHTDPRVNQPSNSAANHGQLLSNHHQLSGLQDPSLPSSASSWMAPNQTSQSAQALRSSSQHLPPHLVSSMGMAAHRAPHVTSSDAADSTFLNGQAQHHREGSTPNSTSSTPTTPSKSAALQLRIHQRLEQMSLESVQRLRVQFGDSTLGRALHAYLRTRLTTPQPQRSQLSVNSYASGPLSAARSVDGRATPSSARSFPATPAQSSMPNTPGYMPQASPSPSPSVSSMRVNRPTALPIAMPASTNTTTATAAAMIPPFERGPMPGHGVPAGNNSLSPSATGPLHVHSQQLQALFIAQATQQAQQAQQTQQTQQHTTGVIATAPGPGNTFASPPMTLASLAQSGVVAEERAPCPICGGRGRRSAHHVCSTCYGGIYNDLQKWLKSSSHDPAVTISIDQLKQELRELPRGCTNYYACTPDKFAHNLEQFERCTRCRTLHACTIAQDLVETMMRTAVRKHNAARTPSSL